MLAWSIWVTLSLVTLVIIMKNRVDKCKYGQLCRKKFFSILTIVQIFDKRLSPYNYCFCQGFPYNMFFYFQKILCPLILYCQIIDLLLQNYETQSQQNKIHNKQAIQYILYGFVDFNMQHIEDTCQFVIRIQCFEDMILSQFDFFVA